jgi:hypothetical protein
LPQAVVTILGAIQIQVGTPTSPTTFWARVCTGLASLIGVALLALLVAALSRVFDRTFSFEDRR